MSGSQQLLLGGSQAAAVDPFFYSVTSLLHGDGTNGAQNNTFLDSSTNNFTITRNGNTTQGSFSPFSQTGWSNYFNGSSGYLRNTSTSISDFGTGNFTAEVWVYKVTSAAGFVYDGRSTGGNGPNFQIYFDSNNKVITVFNGSTVFTSTIAVPLNQWTHVVICRGGTGSNQSAVFIGGIRSDLVTLSGTYTNGDNVIGAAAYTPLGAAVFPGYISNFRIVKGTDVYGYTNTSITVPTAPLTAISGTSLLTCQSNRFIDNSSNNYALSVSGSPSVQPFSPFNPTTPYSTSAVGGSGYFDGSGDYLQNTSVTNQFDVGSAFTLELWVYVTTYQEAGWINVGGSTVNWSTTTGLYWSLYQFGGTLYWQTGNGSGGAISMITATSPSAGAWHHVAIGYNGTTTRMWIDGASVGTSTSSYFKPSGVDRFQIGGFTGGSPVFQGYFSGLRFVKGTDVYGVGNTTLTVPTAPPTAISGTSLLTNFTNAGIFDNAADADYETVGNAQISTSVKKYGTGSMAFDGTGDYLTIPYNQFMNFGTGDFTIEGWFYLNSFANQYYVLGGTWTTGTSDEWLIQIENNGSLRFLTTANTSFFATGLIKTGTWYHFAASRNAGVIKAYINGTAFATIANTNSIGSTSKVLNIGQQPGGTWPWNGYVDDWRISKGVGRYPYNFTPPTAEFPNIGGTVTLTADPYFDYTTLLLPGNGTNGAQNNTFLDSSTNNFTITRNGNTTQGTFSPFSQTGWGNYFDGTGDYLDAGSSTAFGLGTGDFTIEMWVYPTANPANGPGTLFDLRTGTTATACNSRIDSSLNLLFYNGPANTEITVGTVALNTWTQIAFVRSSGTLITYINGTQRNSSTVSGDLGTTQACWIAANRTAGYNFNGYISNFRIVKGTAVYTVNFTPPTTPLTAVSGTSILTCQSNRFVDNSSNAFAITRNGDVSVQAFSPFNPTAAWSAATYGGSGYFDGSGDYLTVPDDADFDFGSGEFTVEAFFYPTSTGDRVIVSAWSSPDTNSAWEIIYFSGTLYCQVASSSTVTTLTTSSYPLNQWNHIAMVRTGNTLSAYLNGTRFATTAYSSTINNGNNGPSIGARAGGSSFPYLGYLSGVRIIKGAGPYDATSSSLTVPTAPLTAISNTQLLANFTNAGIYDATSKNDLETVGNAQISTTQSKFGGSSMYFDGTGDWLTIPNGQNFVFGSGDWTVELWVRPASSSRQGFATLGNSTGTNIPWEVGINASGKFRALVQTSGGQVIIDGTTTPSANTWYHVAVARYGGTVTLYVNGVAEATGSVSTNALVTETSPVYVGAYNYGFPLTGYIDDLRVTKGIARYTSNFIPPTTAFLTL